MYLFNKFGKVKADVGHWVLTKLQGKGEQLLIKVVVVHLPRDLLDQKDSVDALRELFMCIELFGFGLQGILEPPLVESTGSLLL